MTPHKINRLKTDYVFDIDSVYWWNNKTELIFTDLLKTWQTLFKQMDRNSFYNFLLWIHTVANAHKHLEFDWRH